MGSYRDLVVWQEAVSMVTSVYEATRVFPREETYGLTGQIRRSAVSVPSNIAEGQGRHSPGEFTQFLGHARGSLFELETQLVIAGNLGYLTQEQSSDLNAKTARIARLLNALLSSLKRQT